jgi:hypothetical protein
MYPQTIAVKENKKIVICLKIKWRYQVIFLFKLVAPCIKMRNIEFYPAFKAKSQRVGLII